jgi:hypothetical protein
MIIVMINDAYVKEKLLLSVVLMMIYDTDLMQKRTVCQRRMKKIVTSFTCLVTVSSYFLSVVAVRPFVLIQMMVSYLTLALRRRQINAGENKSELKREGYTLLPKKY